MSCILRRMHSSTSSPINAQTIAHQFLSKHNSIGPKSSTQFLDPNQASLLLSTLSRTSDTTVAATRPPAHDVPLPPGHHLAYFTPSQPESALGPDGSDTSYNPASPFTRRMWAGGELRWESMNTLKVGEVVKETTTVTSAEPKVTRTGEEMIVAAVQKVFENQNGVAVVDKRSWIFRPSLTSPQPVVRESATVEPPDGQHTRDFNQTPVSLFRFSAITFNGHKIHYDREWCREVEGHRDLVVHGPLNLILILDFWRDVIAQGAVVVPKSITYRATHPIYASEKYRIILDEEIAMATRV